MIASISIFHIFRIVTDFTSHTKHHDHKHVMYAGRDPSASVATGLKAQHTKEEAALLEMAFSVKQDKLKGE
jgi:2-oxoglutarate dehydrogenase E1 component